MKPVMKASKGNGYVQNGQNGQAKGQQKEISYEDLKKIAIQYQQKCFALEKELKNTKTVFIRLDLLFKVIGLADKFSGEFVAKCAEEIENLLTIPEKKEEEQGEPAEENAENSEEENAEEQEAEESGEGE